MRFDRSTLLKIAAAGGTVATLLLGATAAQAQMLTADPNNPDFNRSMSQAYATPGSPYYNAYPQYPAQYPTQYPAQAPVYTQPATVYAQPAYAPAPVYAPAPYYAPPPVSLYFGGGGYYGRPYYRGGYGGYGGGYHHGGGHWR